MRTPVLGGCVTIGLVAGLATGCGGGSEVTAAQRKADAGMQFGTVVAAQDLGMHSDGREVRGPDDLDRPLSTGYQGTRVVDVYFADDIYCIAVGPAPGAAAGSQDAWVSAGVGTSPTRVRMWPEDTTTCDDALDGIRDVRTPKPEGAAKRKAMLRALDRSRVEDGLGRDNLSLLESLPG